MFVYNVCCTFEDDKQSVADEWLEWLRSEHLSDVCQAGARSAKITQLDDKPLQFEIRYEFQDRESFEHYETNHAPRLRKEGLERFHPSRGLRYERSTGEVLTEFTP